MPMFPHVLHPIITTSTATTQPPAFIISHLKLFELAVCSVSSTTACLLVV